MHYKIWQARKHEIQPCVNPHKSGDKVFRKDRSEKKLSVREWVTFKRKCVQIFETNLHHHSGNKVSSVCKDRGADLKNAKHRHPAPHGTAPFSK